MANGYNPEHRKETPEEKLNRIAREHIQEESAQRRERKQNPSR
jgi:hypothetical protein